MPTFPHIPVLLREVIDGLRCRQGGLFLDGTLGGGGHTEAILQQHPDNRVLALDRDPDAIRMAAQRLASYADRVSIHHQRFEEFEHALAEVKNSNFTDTELACLQGILLDLGVSSMQLDAGERGFSFQQEARLDMRMDTSAQSPSPSAYEIINSYSAEHLADVFYHYGEERQSRRIARKIVEARREAPIVTTTHLADIVFRAVPKRFHPKGIHPATRVFQALRIEVNEELQHLDDTLERLIAYLLPGGRIAVIAFHSLEDRIIKRCFARLAKGCQCPPDFPQCVCGKAPTLKIVTRKPLVANEAERQDNPRSRSAKLRIAEKLPGG